MGDVFGYIVDFYLCNVWCIQQLVVELFCQFVQCLDVCIVVKFNFNNFLLLGLQMDFWFFNIIWEGMDVIDCLINILKGFYLVSICYQFDRDLA